MGELPAWWPFAAAGAAVGAVISAVVAMLLAQRARHRHEQAQAALNLEKEAALSREMLVVADRDRLAAQLDTTRQALSDGQAQLSAALARVEAKDEALRDQVAQFQASRQQLRAEFENLSREFLQARTQELRTNNQDSIGALLKPLSEKIEGFQHRVNQVHADMVQNSGALTEQIRGLERVGLTMSADASNLTRALKGDKKLVGNWGEAQLERTLELAGLRPGEHYQSQASFRTEAGQRLAPDFVIHLPEGKHLVVDSKVSLVDYEMAIAASDEGEQQAALARHAAAVKAHIDSLSAKDYAQLPDLGSPDFVLMFMPIEPAYIEVMKQHRDLFNYGYQRNVVLVSHSTLMPILRTVANLWLMERGNKEAREISERAGDIFNSVCLVAERLQGLGASLQTVTRKYNDTVTAVVGQQGLHGRVERFQQLSARANKQFPEQLRTLPTDIDNDRLAVVNQTPENGGDASNVSDVGERDTP